MGYSSSREASSCPDNQEISPFMEPQYALLHLQEPATGPHPEQDQSIPHRHKK
jgi:hypothetical protein